MISFETVAVVRTDTPPLTRTGLHDIPETYLVECSQTYDRQATELIIHKIPEETKVVAAILLVRHFCEFAILLW